MLNVGGSSHPCRELRRRRQSRSPPVRCGGATSRTTWGQPTSGPRQPCGTPAVLMGGSAPYGSRPSGAVDLGQPRRFRPIWVGLAAEALAAGALVDGLPLVWCSRSACSPAAGHRQPNLPVLVSSAAVGRCRRESEDRPPLPVASDAGHCPGRCPACRAPTRATAGLEHGQDARWSEGTTAGYPAARPAQPASTSRARRCVPAEGQPTRTGLRRSPTTTRMLDPPWDPGAVRSRYRPHPPVSLVAARLPRPPPPTRDTHATAPSPPRRPLTSPHPSRPPSSRAPDTPARQRLDASSLPAHDQDPDPTHLLHLGRGVPLIRNEPVACGSNAESAAPREGARPQKKRRIPGQVLTCERSSNPPASRGLASRNSSDPASRNSPGAASRNSPWGRRPPGPPRSSTTAAFLSSTARGSRWRGERST